MISSKDLAKRLRFDLFPKPDLFRRFYLLSALVLAVAGLLVWFGLRSGTGNSQYLPGPVTQNHATFGERCEECHDPFRNVQDQACLSCHPARGHSPFVVEDVACRSCHVEHRGDAGMLDVANPSCVSCHGSLASSRGVPEVARDVSSFAAHPEFVPLRAPGSDKAALRFNHRIHLASEKVRQSNPGGAECASYRELTCDSCHRVDVTGKLMEKVTFDQDCRCCHRQEVSGPIGSVEAPHAEPDVVRQGIAAQIALLGITRGGEIFSGRDTMLPGVAGRGPIDESRSLAEYQRGWVKRIETALYAPFVDRSPLLEKNKYCFLCHDASKPYVPGEALPVLKDSAVPTRWLIHGEFGHRKHEMLRCEECHAQARQSASTSDVSLPRRELCERCHSADPISSAGTECALCHLYHDTSKDPARRLEKRKPMSIPELLGTRAIRADEAAGGEPRGPSTTAAQPG